MSYADHIEPHRRADGSYDFDAAEKDWQREMEASPRLVVRLIAKAAHQDREAYLRQETSRLRKQFEQPALSPALELDVMVPLGDGTGVRLGDMNEIRIRARKDMRVRTHLHELRAFEAEMTHWLHTEPLLKGDETIAAAIDRGDAA